MDPVTPPAAEVQPDPGQGQQQQQDPGLYPDMSAVPESIQAQVLPLLKEFEGNVTRKFQEAADFRKQWEPFQEIGIHELGVDDVKELLEFRQIAQDPDSFREWYDAVGKEMGWAQQQMQQAQDPQAPALDGLQEMLAKALDERLGPIEQAYQQQEQSRSLQEAESFVQTKLDEIATEHGDFDRDAVCQLALAYDNEGDAIERGFADYQRLVGLAEKNLMEGKLNAPQAPEQGGRPNSAVPEVRTFDQAKSAARELMQRAMQQ